MNYTQIILKKIKISDNNLISFKNTLHHPLSLFYASQKVFDQTAKILKMNNEGRKGEGKKCELKVNEVGEKENETEDAVRYEKVERIEEEGNGEEYERRRENNIKFTPSIETHEVGLFTDFLLHKLRAIACEVLCFL